MRRDPLSVVQGAYSALACGDTPGLLARLAPGVVWEVAGQPGAHPTGSVPTGRVPCSCGGQARERKGKP